MDFKIISIGTLAKHSLWNETSNLRTGHATTTVIKSNKEILLVDPSLPAPIIDAKLHERWGLRISDITHVFLTSFDVDRQRAIADLTHAKWYMYKPEIEGTKIKLQEEWHRNKEDQELSIWLEKQIDLLDKFELPDDCLMEGVDLFPLPGYTMGTCGLLLPTPKRTIVLAGDAVPTSEHLERCVVLQECQDIENAQESMKECLEIADIIIPGRDNILLNPIRT